MKKLLCGLLWVASVGAEQPRPLPNLHYPPGAGAAIARSRCTSCHGAETFLNARLDPVTWKQTLHKELSERGARLSEQEKPVLLAYLISNFRRDTPKKPPARVVLQ